MRARGLRNTCTFVQISTACPAAFPLAPLPRVYPTPCGGACPTPVVLRHLVVGRSGTAAGGGGRWGVRAARAKRPFEFPIRSSPLYSIGIMPSSSGMSVLSMAGYQMAILSLNLVPKSIGLFNAFHPYGCDCCGLTLAVSRRQRRKRSGRCWRSAPVLCWVAGDRCGCPGLRSPPPP
jgi:hypothetical protein